MEIAIRCHSVVVSFQAHLLRVLSQLGATSTLEVAANNKIVPLLSLIIDDYLRTYAYNFAQETSAFFLHFLPVQLGPK